MLVDIPRGDARLAENLGDSNDCILIKVLYDEFFALETCYRFGVAAFDHFAYTLDNRRRFALVVAPNFSFVMHSLDVIGF